MNQKSPTRQPSAAHQPDLDWSQVRETVMMLNLAVAQISGAMQEGDESLKTLSDSFTAMMENVAEIRKSAESLPDDSPQGGDIAQHCGAISGQMETAIVAFQFYDRLNQRLCHLTDSLAALGSLVASPDKLYNPHAWKQLQDDIKSRYTVESDKAMFDAILGGASVEEALQHCRAQQPTKGDDIELF